ncbi:MAG: hypothetical protein ACREUU_21895, partial [Gammaproteobacteria bacterium]
IVRLEIKRITVCKQPRQRLDYGLIGLWCHVASPSICSGNRASTQDAQMIFPRAAAVLIQIRFAVVRKNTSDIGVMRRAPSV